MRLRRGLRGCGLRRLWLRPASAVRSVVAWRGSSAACRIAASDPAWVSAAAASCGLAPAAAASAARALAAAVSAPARAVAADWVAAAGAAAGSAGFGGSGFGVTSAARGGGGSRLGRRRLRLRRLPAWLGRRRRLGDVWVARVPAPIVHESTPDRRSLRSGTGCVEQDRQAEHDRRATRPPACRIAEDDQPRRIESLLKAVPPARPCTAAAVPPVRPAARRPAPPW